MSDPAAASSKPAPEPAVSATPQPQAEPIDYANAATPLVRERFSLLRAGGALGVAAVIVCVILFVLACFGLNAAFRFFPYVPLLLSIVGVLLTLVGGVWRSPQDEDPYVLFGLFVNALGLLSALLEMNVPSK